MADSKKSSVKKSILKTLLAILILFIILISAGFAYTWYLGKDVVNDVEIVDNNPTAQPNITRPTLDPNSPVGASVQSISSPVKPGEEVSAIIKTRPLADCSIVVEYNKIPSKNAQLMTKKADDFGVVSWSWTVEQNTPNGKWPVKITCKFGEKSGYVEGELEVKA